MPQKKIALLQDVSFQGLTLTEAIENRRSKRRFSGESMSFLELSRLLYYGVGITERRYGFRAAPSAGALYPVELYPVVSEVEGLARGIYRYSVEDHSLELVKEGDFREEVSLHSRRQRMVGRANVAFVLAGVFEKMVSRYRERAYRYVFLEAGHIGQNLYLAATAMGMGACAIGAFSDEDFNRLLGIDGERESTLYIMVVGKVKGEGQRPWQNDHNRDGN